MVTGEQTISHAPSPQKCLPEKAGSIQTPHTALTNGWFSKGASHQYLLMGQSSKEHQTWTYHLVQMTLGQPTSDIHWSQLILMIISD